MNLTSGSIAQKKGLVNTFPWLRLAEALKGQTSSYKPYDNEANPTSSASGSSLIQTKLLP